LRRLCIGLASHDIKAARLGLIRLCATAVSDLSSAKLLRNFRFAFALLLFLSWACADPRTVVMQRAFIQWWIRFLAGEGTTQHLGKETYCKHLQ
jgi:hypothetical protein